MRISDRLDPRCVSRLQTQGQMLAQLLNGRLVEIEGESGTHGSESMYIELDNGRSLLLSARPDPAGPWLNMELLT